MQRVTGWIGATAAALGLMTAGTALGQDLEDPEIGAPAPQFELEDVEGNTHALSDYEGKTVVLHWQSTVCPWEVDEYQTILRGHYEEYAQDNEDVVFLGINSNHTESDEQIREYIEEWGVPYPILRDPGNQVADDYAARTTPHLYIIDSDEDQTLRYMGGYEEVPGTLTDIGNMGPQFIPALEAVLAGEEAPYERTQSKGCMIAREN